MKIPSPLKWHGGKHYLASRIVALMPPHLHYVEPYFGGGSVLLAKNPEGISEVVNDKYGDLINFWLVLQGPKLFPEFCRQAQAIPFCETHWQAAEAYMRIHPVEFSDYTERALRFFVLCRMSLAGRMNAFAPLSKTRTRRGMNEQASAWLQAVEGLPAVHARLKRVAILNHDALDVIRQQDGRDTLFYCDPPYLHETRAAKLVYDLEMTNEQHGAMLRTLLGCRGKVLLSGYRSKMYDDLLSSWNRRDFDLPNNSAGGASKRRMTECLWTNF